MYLKQFVLLLSLAAVFFLIYVVRVDKRCSAHTFTVGEQQI